MPARRIAGTALGGLVGPIVLGVLVAVVVLLWSARVLRIHSAHPDQPAPAAVVPAPPRVAVVAPVAEPDTGGADWGRSEADEAAERDDWAPDKPPSPVLEVLDDIASGIKAVVLTAGAVLLLLVVLAHFAPALLLVGVGGAYLLGHRIAWEHEQHRREGDHETP
jgi:hypothetical protein